MGVLGGVFVLKSGLRILIRAPEVPFSVPPKTPKMGVFGYFGGTENGTSGARIKILRPLFNTNTPPKIPACILALLCLCLYLFVFLFVYDGDDLAWFVPRWYVPLVHAANQLLSPMHLYSFPFKQHQLFLFEKCFLIVR